MTRFVEAAKQARTTADLDLENHRLKAHIHNLEQFVLSAADVVETCWYGWQAADYLRAVIASAPGHPPSDPSAASRPDCPAPLPPETSS